MTETTYAVSTAFFEAFIKKIYCNFDTLFLFREKDILQFTLHLIFNLEFLASSMYGVFLLSAS